jgi:hypothetical protein
MLVRLEGRHRVDATNPQQGAVVMTRRGRRRRRKGALVIAVALLFIFGFLAAVAVDGPRRPIFQISAVKLKLSMMRDSGLASFTTGFRFGANFIN